MSDIIKLNKVWPEKPKQTELTVLKTSITSCASGSGLKKLFDMSLTMMVHKQQELTG